MSETTNTRNTSADAHRAAMSKLKGAHPEEYQGYVVEYYQSRGLAYKPRRSKEQREQDQDAAKFAKAQATVAKLLDQYGPEVIPS